MELSDDAWNVLRTMVIKQAIYDLQRSYRHVATHDGSKLQEEFETMRDKYGSDDNRCIRAYQKWNRYTSAERDIAELEDFFNGSYYAKLCPIEGQIMIDRARVQATYRKRNKIISRGRKYGKITE